MLVKLFKDSISIHGNFRAGSVVDFPTYKANSLVYGGFAEFCDDGEVCGLPSIPLPEEPKMEPKEYYGNDTKAEYAVEEKPVEVTTENKGKRKRGSRTKRSTDEPSIDVSGSQATSES